jgi:two-component system, OmpR family, phosphate regulon sensor histidine kinase PhoR
MFKAIKYKTNTPSMRKRILVPFIATMVFLAIFSILISLHFISKAFNKRIVGELENSRIILESQVKENIDKMIFFTTIIPEIENYLPYINTNIIHKSKPLQKLFKKEGINTYWNTKAIPKYKLTAYEPLIKSAKTGKTLRKIIVFKANNKTEIVAVAATAVKTNKNFKPLIMEMAINNGDFFDIKTKNDKTEICLIYVTGIEKTIQTEIFGKTKLLDNTKAKTQINKLFQKSIRTNTAINKLSIDGIPYKVNFVKWPYHNDIFFSIIVPYEDLYYTNLRIIVGIITILALIVLWLFAIYLLKIDRITQSINKVSEFAKKIALGDFQENIEIDDSILEVNALIASLNQMMQNVHKSAEEIIDEKNKLNAIISNIPHGIIITDIENRLIKANKQAERMFDFSANKIKGKYLLEYLHNENLSKALKQASTKGKGKLSREIKIPNKETNKINTYILSSAFVTNQHGENINIVTGLYDVTHQKELEELRESFLRTVSHELRTPLTTIIGFLNLISKAAGDQLSKDQKSYLDIVLKESKNLEEIINDLLDITKIKAGKVDITVNECNIYTFLQDIVASFTPMVKSKSLKIISDFDLKDEIILTDSCKLRRIFVNFVSNAIKFTSEGSITLSCQVQEKTVLFCVEDTGIGLKEDELDIIFEKFRQVDYSEDRKYEGMGIGLSIVKQLVILLNGKVWVESEYKKGSKFFVSIPKILKPRKYS